MNKDRITAKLSRFGLVPYFFGDNSAFAVHKIKLPSGAKASAWFDECGKLVDAERITKAGVSCQVKPGTSAWFFIESLVPPSD